MDVDNESDSSACQGETPCGCSSVASFGEFHRPRNHLGRHRRYIPQSLLRVSGGAKAGLTFAGNEFLRRASLQNKIFFLQSYSYPYVIPKLRKHNRMCVYSGNYRIRRERSVPKGEMGNWTDAPGRLLLTPETPHFLMLRKHSREASPLIQFPPLTRKTPSPP